MICPIDTKHYTELQKKYPFLQSIKLECVEKNNSQVYMDAKVVMKTTPCPESYYDFKWDVYSLVKEQTNKVPVLRNGWNLELSNKN
jgi:hypothetical protein